MTEIYKVHFLSSTSQVIKENFIQRFFLATSQRFADATKKFETVQMELAGDISNIKSEIKKLMETVTGVEDLKKTNLTVGNRKIS